MTLGVQLNTSREETLKTAPLCVTDGNDVSAKYITAKAACFHAPERDSKACYIRQVGGQRIYNRSLQSRSLISSCKRADKILFI